jgi:hypothetical protein
MSPQISYKRHVLYMREKQISCLTSEADNGYDVAMNSIITQTTHKQGKSSITYKCTNIKQ